MSGKFRFSRRSEKNLEGVKPQLVAVVHRAIELMLLRLSLSCLNWWRCASVMNGVRLKPARSMRMAKTST